MAAVKTGVKAKAGKVTTVTKPTKSTAKSTAKSTKPEKLSKVSEWWLAHPKGIEATYIDWKAVMR